MAHQRDSARNILDCIRHIVRALHVSSRAGQRSHGLGAAQLFVLRQLQLEGGRPVSINELAERTLTHQSSVSVVVSKLVDQKLVSRKPSTEDSRRMDVSLTETGRRKLGKAPRSMQEDLVDALERMPAKDRDKLADLLSRLLQDAGYLEGTPPLLFEESTEAESSANEGTRS